MVHSVARVTSDTGELAVGILPYFMDGILPLLKVIVGDIECDRVAGVEGVLSWEEALVLGQAWGRGSWSMVDLLLAGRGADALTESMGLVGGS